MKKKVLIIVLPVIMIFMAGCNSMPSAKSLEMANPALSINKDACDAGDDNIEYGDALTDSGIYSANEASNETIYNLKSVSVFITSQNEDVNEIQNLSMTYIGIKFEDSANIGTDTLKRESLRPRKITGFGEVIKIAYIKSNPIDISKTKLSAEVKFVGFKTNQILEKEETISLNCEDTESSCLSGVLILNNQSDLKLIFKAEIESI